MTERIILEVQPETARKWRTSSQERKKEIAQRMDIRLAKELSESRKEFMQFLDELGQTMEERGLTEDILREILEDEN